MVDTESNTYTIFAPSTAPGRAAIAVIRLSGPASFPVLETLAGTLPPIGVARPRWLRDPGDGTRIDRALVVRFTAPASFTGEDVAELHFHGSAAVTRRLLAMLEDMPGLRAAEAGEFTRRALMNGKLDLAEVEGLGDLLVAETEAQHRQAMRLMDGSLSRRAAGWKESLVAALAMSEVSIDFADEDLPPDVVERAVSLLRDCAADMDRAIAGSVLAERLREGFEVALVGPPNAGKSTLLNALAGRDVALTSEVAGTTRDVIEVRMDLGGLPVTLLDMAGIRDASETVEAMGVERAKRRASEADLRIFLIDGPDPGCGIGPPRRDGDIVLRTKADLHPAIDVPAVSGLTGQGIDELLVRIGAVLGERAAGAGAVSHERQRRAITASRDAALAAIAQLDTSAGMAEVAGACLHEALAALEFLVGKADTEAVLDVVFRNFCIGK